MSVARSSTATATTATADPPARGVPYRGRFAPSPTGLLHLGSLVAALASFLDARHHGGQWLLRIEDLDPPRTVPGAADAILRTLERLDLHWDGEVILQSTRRDAHHEALAALAAAGHLYACDCTRRETSGPYPGTCRGRTQVAGLHALRFTLPGIPGALDFTDRWQGPRTYTAAALGDPVVRRRDGLVAYQLAVVVDDAWQGITDVVRGADLLDSTPWQRALQAALTLPHLRHAHVPLVTEPGGAKLAKSRRSLALDEFEPAACLHQALRLLGQQPPPDLAGAGTRVILEWALAHWHPGPLRNRAEIAVEEGLGFGGSAVIR